MKFLESIQEKYFLRALQIIIGIIFALPVFSLSSFYFPFITPRNFAFRILVELLAVIYLLLVLKNSAYRPRRDRLFFIFLAFVGVMTVSSLINGDIIYSFWSNFERMDGLVSLFHLTVFLLICRFALKEKKLWEELMQVSLVIAMAVTFVGLGQLLKVNILLESSGGDRIASTLGNPTYLAAYLTIHLFFAAYFLFTQKENVSIVWRYGFIALDVVIVILSLFVTKRGSGQNFIELVFSDYRLWIPLLLLQFLAFAELIKGLQLYRVWICRGLYAIVGVLLLVIISQTQTRGALVGLGLALVWLAITLQFQPRVPRTIRTGSLAIVVVGIALTAWLFTQKNSDWVVTSPLLSRITSISTTDSTTQTRLVTWNAGWQGIKERPILGWGTENFYRVFDKYFPTEIYNVEDAVVWFDRPHNMIIQYAVEGGLVGAVLYLIFVIGLTLQLFKKRLTEPSALLWAALLIAYIGQNLFVFDSINSSVFMMFATAFMMFLVRDEAAESNSKPILANWLYASIVLVVVAGWLLNVGPIQSNRRFLHAYLLSEEAKSQNQLTPNELDLLFSAVEEAPYLGRLELAAVAAERIKGYYQSDSLPEYDLQQFADRAEKNVKAVIAQHPDDVRTYVLLMDFYLNLNSLNSRYLDEIVALRDKAVSLSPTRAQIYLLTGNAYMFLKQYDKGVAEFEIAQRLAPGVYDPNYNLFGSYLATKQIEKAQPMVETILRLRDYTPDVYLRVASMFAKSRYYPEAENILEQAIERYPQNPNLYAAIADVYGSQGKNKEAEDAVFRAVDLDASFKTEADAFLKELRAGRRLKK